MTQYILSYLYKIIHTFLPVSIFGNLSLSFPFLSRLFFPPTLEGGNLLLCNLIMYLIKCLVGLSAATAGVAAMPAPTPAAIYDVVERAPEPSLEARQGDGCSFQTFVVHVILEMHQANETQDYFRCNSYKHHNRLCLRCTCFRSPCFLLVISNPETCLGVSTLWTCSKPGYIP